MRGESASFYISLSNMGLNLFVEGIQKFVRGRSSFTDEKD
jgi:hypothetical protein